MEIHVGSGRRFGFGASAVLLLCMSLLACSAVCAKQATAAETPPELLWQVPADEQPGSEAGRMINPRGVAANPITGNVLVADHTNSRIDEFTVWGQFVKAWGFGVEDGSAELQVCTAETGCQAGLAGSSPGQLGGPLGVAIDAAGAVYVYDLDNGRVTKYSEDGEYLLTFEGSFENATVGNFIAVGPANTIFVGDKGRIQEFNPDGTFKSEIPFTGDLAALAGVSVSNLAVDFVSGDLYFDTPDNNVYRISPAGELVEIVEETMQINGETETFPVLPGGLAVDSGGNLFVADSRSGGRFEVLKFSPSGECLLCGTKFALPFNPAGGFPRPAINGLATSDACEISGSDLYVTVFKGNEPRVSYLQSYGPAPQDSTNCPPPEVAPEIAAEYAVDVGTETAKVGAQINPNFWNDTRYYVQWGLQDCFDSSWTAGCNTTPLPPGDLLTDKVLNRPIASDEVLLENLQPGTTYYYRFAAQSTGSGGVPVFGAGSSFRTFPLRAEGPSCSNDLFRTGLSAFLVDCRAYEMVSPVDKNGGDILAQKSIRNHPVSLDVVAEDGESVTYSSQAAFANSVSAPYASQYIARRDEDAGWQTEAISPPRKELFSPAGSAEVFELDNQYKLFSPDLGSAWLMQEADPPLDGCGVENFINWYRRDNATGAYEAVTTKEPPNEIPIRYLPEVQGVSADGALTVYRANDKLPVDTGVDAASLDGYQIYQHTSGPDCGQTSLVSVLPNGTANPTESSVGTAGPGTTATFVESRENLVHNAVSADGSRIYWTAAGEGPGKIYVRANGAETFAVSSGSARFWFAAQDGSSAYFTEGENLRRFNFPGPGSTLIAGKVIGLLGASEDGSRAYFVSTADLDGGGGPAAAGQPNLYMVEGSTTTYVATLSASDVSPELEFKPASVSPVARTSSLSEDGRFLAFTSGAPLTGHDNVDTASGLSDTEAFLYEADSGDLRCLSCSFTGARPTGRVLLSPSGRQEGYASRIPPWKNQFHAPRVIAAGGSTVFFESLGRLVPRDENGKQDVYMWTRTDDETACKAVGAELYNPDAGGCISLISSGTGTDDSDFVDSTPDGSDVFFKTRTSLVSQDPGRVDLYDARVEGGFPPPPVPPTPKVPCEGGCPVPPVSNADSGSGTSNFDPATCKPLQQKAQRLAAKARKLRKKAGKAQGAKAIALAKQAKKAAKKAKRASARAQSCATGAKGR